MNHRSKIRNLVVVLGDQLNQDSAVFDNFDPETDIVWMAEVHEESTHVWTHRARIALFLSAMRHYRDALIRKGIPVHYRELDAPDKHQSFTDAFADALKKFDPHSVVMVEPGEYRVRQMFEACCASADTDLHVLEDRHFICSHAEFDAHAEGRKQLRLEFFYRELRRKHSILMDEDQPQGGQWNYDADNRGSFGKSGPPEHAAPKSFRPDKTTREVLKLVATEFPEHPGSLSAFDWPVTPRQAQTALRDFLDHRLQMFGQYQDAMWTDEPYLFHSRISAALNLKLLDPRVVIEEAVGCWKTGRAPLNAVEGFVRQILGWREYVRGIYWRFMPEYIARNSLNATRNLPEFYWTGETDMACLSQTIGQTLETGYAHHIQRLMITGLFALLFGVDPRQVHEWYLAVYVDAVEWVELPNTLGMSQYADNGIMASKPYSATGKYIKRMSNYCGGCKYHPDHAVGDDACPFTTLYWDFLARHRDAFSNNQRMGFQLRNLDKKSDDDLAAIRTQAAQVLERYARPS